LDLVDYCLEDIARACQHIRATWHLENCAWTRLASVWL